MARVRFAKGERVALRPHYFTPTEDWGRYGTVVGGNDLRGYEVVLDEPEGTPKPGKFTATPHYLRRLNIVELLAELGASLA